MCRRDEVPVWNERVKLFAGFLNALALGLIGFAVLRPVTEDISLLSRISIGWTVIAMAIHFTAHYVLGQLKKDERDDGL